MPNEFDEFIKYNKALNEFYNFIEYHKTNENNKSEVNYEGYLINLDDFKSFKQNINYDSIKNCFQKKENNNNKESIINYFDKENFKKIKKVKNIEIKSYNFLIRMIMNKNEYILITDELWKVIGAKEEKEDPPLIFSIKESKLVLNFNDNKKLSFSYQENIINENLLIGNAQKIYKNLENYFESIVEYNNIEKLFFKNLQNENLNISKLENKYFLVDTKWINEWKLFTNYNYIKRNCYKENNFNKKNTINNIIYHQEKYKNIYKLNSLNLLKFKTFEDIEKYIKYNSIAIITSKFKNLFDKDNQENGNYCIKINNNNNISINLNNDTKIFNTKNNIILNNENYYFKELKQLIKIFYFQEQLIQLINKPFSEILQNENDKKEIYLINKNIISNYKLHYEYKTLFNNLKNVLNSKKDNKEENIIINYEYNLSDDNLDKIINKLNKEYIDKIKKKEKYIPQNKDNEEFKFNEKYIDNFEIINYDILFYFLENKIIEDNNYLCGQCIYGNKKIFLAFKENENDKYFYEIGSFNKNNNFNLEYCITTNTIMDINIIIKDITKYGFDKFIEKACVNKNGNCIIINEKYKIYSNKIIEEPIENDKNMEKEHFIFIKKNISILLSIYRFNIELKKDIGSLNQIESEGYLINKNLLSEYKQILLHKTIIDIFNNRNKEEIENNINSFIINNKKYYLNITQKNIFDIFKKYPCFNPDLKELSTKDNKIIFFTDEFEIIDEKILNTFFNILKENIEIEKQKQIKYYFKEEKLIFHYKNTNINSTINICSINEENENIFFIPEIILNYSKIEEINNQLQEINRKSIIDNFFSKEISEIKDKNGNIIGNSYLIKNNKNILNISYKDDNSNDSILKINLNIWINICIQQSKFNEKIKEYNNSKKSESINCYNK